MARKISTWKQKKPYVVHAPEYFEGKELGVTLSSDPAKLKGRTIKVPFSDLTGDRSKQHIKVSFEVSELRGENAHTTFKSYGIIPGYLKSKIRRGMGKVDYIQDVTVGGKKARVKVLVLTRNSITRAQKSAIFQRVMDVLKTHESSSFEEFVQLVLFGKMGTEIYHKVKGISPIGRVELYSLRLV